MQKCGTKRKKKINYENELKKINLHVLEILIGTVYGKKASRRSCCFSKSLSARFFFAGTQPPTWESSGSESGKLMVFS